MLNGAKPDGRFGSVNFPAKSGAPASPLSTSIVPALKLAERRYAWPPVITKVVPLYTLSGDPVWRTSATVPSAPRQPEMVPSSLTKRKLSLLNAPEALAKLNAWPVGVPSPGGGIVTVSPALVVAFVVGFTLYRFATPPPLEETQKG